MIHGDTILSGAAPLCRGHYRLCIAELQARYRLIAGIGAVFYFCDNKQKNEVVVTFFQTDPPTLIAERGDRVSLMYRQPSASGTMYQGRHECFREHQGEVRITWGYGGLRESFSGKGKAGKQKNITFLIFFIEKQT